MKPLLSSLREKKRYVVFKVISQEQLPFKGISKGIKEHFLSLMGEFGYTKSGLMLLHEQWNQSKNTGVAKINHKYVTHLKMALSLIKNIESEKVIVNSLGVSGILAKTKRFV